MSVTRSAYDVLDALKRAREAQNQRTLRANVMKAAFLQERLERDCSCFDTNGYMPQKSSNPPRYYAERLELYDTYYWKLIDTQTGYFHVWNAEGIVLA